MTTNTIIARRELEAALSARTQAHQTLQSASVDLARAQQTADEYRVAADEAKRASDAATVETALQLEHARRDAQAVADAAMRELTRARDARDEREKELAAAVDEVRKVAKQLLWADIQAQMAEFRTTLKTLQRLRASLLGAYLVTPSALGDREWHEIDIGRSVLSAEAMRIGLPIVGSSIFSAADMDALAPDPRSHRALVDQQQVAWTERLADLERGEGFESAAKDAA